MDLTLKRAPQKDPTHHSWFDRWVAERVFVTVAGDADAPYPAHLATLTDLMERFAEIKRAIEAYAGGLDPEAHVPLQTGNGGFAARSCGFADDFYGYQHVDVTDPDPMRATVGFCTGLPDGYVTYEVELLAGKPVGISAYPS